nr:MAG TPA: hypothetical protein [Caudoviricetes sp.]
MTQGVPESGGPGRPGPFPVFRRNSFAALNLRLIEI